MLRLQGAAVLLTLVTASCAGHIIPPADQWPRGVYSLPATDDESFHGCPLNRIWFEPGIRKQKMEPRNNTDLYFQPNNMRGSHNKSYAVMEDHFCTKVEYYGEGQMPRGSYCVNMALEGQCPPHMKTGFIKFDNSQGFSRSFGSVPYGLYGDNTKYYYCCMVDSFNTEPMVLPNTRPFFLYRRKGRCEAVRGMKVQEQKVRYDTMDTLTLSLSGNHDDDWGVTPDHFIDDVVLYLCYYTPNFQFFSGSVADPEWLKEPVSNINDFPDCNK